MTAEILTLPSPSLGALAAVHALHDVKLARLTSGGMFLTVEEEARIVDQYWVEHRSEMERTLEEELHKANQQLARALAPSAIKQT